MKIECIEWEKKMILETIRGDDEDVGHCFFEAKDCCGDCEVCINNNIEFVIKEEK